LGQHGVRHAQYFEEVIIPIEFVDVEEQGAAGVAYVGSMEAAAGEAPEQETIHRAKQDLPLCGAGAQAGSGIEQMFYFGSGEVSVYHQAGALAKSFLQTIGFQAIANRRA